MDAPYSHASPRSGNTLRRAATAAAVNRRLHPQATAGNVEYRRADGRTEHPHESDADNWVPPPPPYQKEDPGDMPDFLRHAIPPVNAAISGAPTTTQGQTQTRQHIAQPQTHNRQLPRSQTGAPSPQSIPAIPPVPRIPTMHTQSPQISLASPHLRNGSSSTAMSGQHNVQRPSSSDSDNIYDVSPPDSPRAAAVGQHDGPSRDPRCQSASAPPGKPATRR